MPWYKDYLLDIALPVEILEMPASHRVLLLPWVYDFMDILDDGGRFADPLLLSSGSIREVMIAHLYKQWGLILIALGNDIPGSRLQHTAQIHSIRFPV